MKKHNKSIHLAGTGCCLMDYIYSGIVVDEKEIKKSGLKLIAPGLDRAFLVEEFCKIMISNIDLPDFNRGISIFEEKKQSAPL